MKHFSQLFCFPKWEYISSLSIHSHIVKCFIKQNLYFLWAMQLIFFTSVLFYSDMLSFIWKINNQFFTYKTDLTTQWWFWIILWELEAYLKSINVSSVIEIGWYKCQCKKPSLLFRNNKVCLKFLRLPDSIFIKSIWRGILSKLHILWQVSYIKR